MGAAPSSSSTSSRVGSTTEVSWSMSPTCLSMTQGSAKAHSPRTGRARSPRSHSPGRPCLEGVPSVGSSWGRQRSTVGAIPRSPSDWLLSGFPSESIPPSTAGPSGGGTFVGVYFNTDINIQRDVVAPMASRAGEPRKRSAEPFRWRPLPSVASDLEVDPFGGERVSERPLETIANGGTDQSGLLGRGAPKGALTESGRLPECAQGAGEKRDADQFLSLFGEEGHLDQVLHGLSGLPRDDVNQLEERVTQARVGLLCTHFRGRRSEERSAEGLAGVVQDVREGVLRMELHVDFGAAIHKRALDHRSAEAGGDGDSPAGLVRDGFRIKARVI